MQAKKTSCEDAAIEIRTEFTLDEASDGRPLLTRIGEKGLEVFLDDFIEKSLVGLVALVVDQVVPFRDRIGVQEVV